MVKTWTLDLKLWVQIPLVAGYFSSIPWSLLSSTPKSEEVLSLHPSEGM